jgi:hypothetical protein
MASKIPYDTSSDALLRPAKNTVFFQGWTPADSQNHDLLCAEMSRLAYAPREVVGSALVRIGFRPPDFIGGDGVDERKDLHGTQGFVTHHPSLGLTVLAFRGTESDKFEDLLSDGKTHQKVWPNSPGCLVHAGFVDGWNPVSERVASLLASREGVLLMTGHSLGAALATLAAIAGKPTKLITFGSPRVGNENLCALLAGVEVRRFVHCCDLVARVPPEHFDQEHVSELFSELALPDLRAFFRPSLLRRGAAAITSAFHASHPDPALDPHFKHAAPARYADRSGKIQADITDEARVLDQEAARRAYRQPATHKSFWQLGKLLARVSASVPFRDLADHAPINYVSLFTGRS